MIVGLALMLTVPWTAGSAELAAGELARIELAQREKSMTTIIASDDAKIGLAPYVWKCSGTGAAARAEATMPGAYLKLAFHESKAIKLLIDGTANHACPESSMPIVEYSVDEGPWKVTQLEKTGELHPLTLAEGLDAGREHRAEIYFRAANLGPKRWESSTVHLWIAGIQLDAGGRSFLLPCVLRER